jgi:hypothetical protein
MKNIISEQNILKLPGDTKWEYAVIGGIWHARKQGTTNWINIETNPKVNNSKAIDLLNKTFPDAKKIGTKVQTPSVVTQKKPMAKILPTDLEKKAVVFEFPNGEYIKLFPSDKNYSKRIMDAFALTTKGGNYFKLPQTASKIECRTKTVIFTNEMPSNVVKDYCTYENINPQYIQKYGILELPKGIASTTPIEKGKVVQENNQLKSLIKKVLTENVKSVMSLNENTEVSDELKYHLDNKISLSENVFRIYSEAYFNLINEVRELYNNNKISLPEDDIWIVESDLGKKVKLSNGDVVYLDAPIYEEDVFEIMNEAKHHGKNVKLNSPFRTPGGPKKFAVYVKTPGGGIKKVTFGDPNLRVRNANKKAAKSFRARHKCDQKKDRTKAGYWSCNVARYAKKLGLKSSRTW